jgi:Uma2 family endonuclease
MSTKTQISCDEFERLCLRGELEGPCELIDGEIVSMAPGGADHGEASGNISFVLMEFVRAQKLGRVLLNETGLHIAGESPRSRGMDCAYISFARWPKSEKIPGFLRAAPELVVEVFGETNTWEELDEKVADYHRTGVDLVWVADPHTRTVKVYPKDGETSLIHDGQEIDGGVALPGFRAAIARFFDPA